MMIFKKNKTIRSVRTPISKTLPPTCDKKLQQRNNKNDF